MLEEEILNILNNSSLIIAQAQILVDLLNSDISKYKKVYILAKLRKLEKQSNGLFRILDTDIKKTVFQIHINERY